MNGVNLEERFWKIIGEMGYPTTIEGVRFMSEEHRELAELEELWEFFKTTGGKIRGFGMAMKIGALKSKYSPVLLVIEHLLSMNNRNSILDDVLDEIRHLPDMIIDRVENYEKNMICLNEWLEKGGAVDAHSLAQGVCYPYFSDNSGEEHMACLKKLQELYERTFSDENLKRYTGIITGFGLGKDARNAVRNEFELGRRRSERAVIGLKNKIKNLCCVAGVDYSDVERMLYGLRAF